MSAVPWNDSGGSDDIHPAHWLTGDRHPLLVTTLLAGLGFLLLADYHLLPADFALFAQAGNALVHGHLRAVFDDPEVQAGPLALALATAMQHATAWLGYGAVPALLYLLCWINAGCLIGAVRAAVGRPGAARGLAAIVAGSSAVALGTLTVSDAHPTHALIALLWFQAARVARGGNPIAAGLLLAVACGLETWGVLGVGLLLLLPGYRLVARAATTTALATAACWLPFVLTGSFHSFDMHWTPAAGSLPALLFGSSAAPWSYRLAQGALAVAAGALIARRLRTSAHSAWLIPAGVVATRLVSDPINFLYYDVPLQIMLLVGLVMLSVGSSAPKRSALTAARVRGLLTHPGRGVTRVGREPLLWAGLALLLPPVGSLVRGPMLEYAPSVGCLVVLVVLLRRRGVALDGYGLPAGASVPAQQRRQALGAGRES